MSINSIYAGSTPHSRDTIRQQYLDNMALDIANMTKNLNANRLFKANGSTGSEPADTRTATEKFADIEGLRQSVKTGLRDITDAMEAQNIINDITTPELEFLAQQLPFIIRDLKPKFALGVPAGSFVPYLRRMMRDNIANEGLAYGLTTAPNVAGGVASTGTELMDKNEWRNLLGSELLENADGDKEQKRRLTEVLAIISKMADLTPTRADREMVAQLRDSGALEEYDRQVASITQNLPSQNELDKAMRAPNLLQINKMLRQQLDGVDFRQLQEFQNFLEEVRNAIKYTENQEFEKSARFFNPLDQAIDDIPSLPRNRNPTIKELREAREERERERQLEPPTPEIFEFDPRNIPSQLRVEFPQQVPAQQDEPALPDAYVSKERINEIVAPYKDQAYSYSEYLALDIDTKKEMLLSYANDGLFNDMDAGFHQMINSLESGDDVPERVMDSEYKKFSKINSLFRSDTVIPEKIDRRDLFSGKSEKERNQMGAEDFNAPQPPEEPYPEELGIPPPPPLLGKKAKLNKFMIQERLQRGDYEDYPNFKAVAEEIAITENVSEEDINNFLTAFTQVKREQEEMGGEDVNVAEARRPAEKAVKAKKTPPVLVEELAGLESFKRISIPQKIDMLESLRDNREIDDIEIIRRVNALAGAVSVKNATLDKIYDDLLISRGQVATLADLPSGSAKAVKKASSATASTEVEGRTPEKGSAKSINAPTEELFATTTPQKATAELDPKYPMTPSAFQKVLGGNETRRAIIEKAYREGVFDRDPIAKKDKSGKETDEFIEISNETYDLAQELFKFGDKIPEKTTSAVLIEAFKGIYPMLKEIKLLGMGLPVPHHVLGPHGYGINGKTQGRPMMQTMGGSLHHTKSAPMGEWGGSLPKNKKKGNIIFGMGLASVIPQPKVKVEGRNINLSAGIEAEPAYVKFGTHLLNKHRLKDNVVMMRTMKGGAIVNIPTQKVSSKLARVLHCISGGAIPAFESVMDLTDGDKALLHQIAKTSKVSDRLSVPNPNKSKLEEEDNRFNILRGEVSIGNDAPAVIKEFKVLLLKFMREGRVPTGQGKAIMEELLLLGY